MRWRNKYCGGSNHTEQFKLKANALKGAPLFESIDLLTLEGKYITLGGSVYDVLKCWSPADAEAEDEIKRVKEFYKNNREAKNNG